MIINILFYGFSSLLLFSSLMVVTVKNSVHAVLFLVLSFICSSGMLVLLQCEFLALMFLIIYVGAIAVLFLFVVMMLDLKLMNDKKDILKYVPFGVLVIALFTIYPALTSVNNFFYDNPYTNNIFLQNPHFNWLVRLDSFTEIQSIGQVVYTQYVLQFLIAGNILLLATLAAVVLTISTETGNEKKQIIFKQLSRNYKNALIV